MQISEINAPVDFVKAASEHLKSRNCKSVASGNIVTTDFEHNGITVLLYINSVYGDLEREYLLESTNEFNKYTDWGKSNKHIKENKCNAQDIFDDYIAEDPWFEGKNDTFMSEFQKEKMKNTIICQSFRIKADAMGCHNATLSIC